MVSERAQQRGQPSAHFVQLCDSSESMSDAAAAFLTDAHEAGDRLLVVARESSWIDIHRSLTARGVDVGAELANGRLISMSAVRKLGELSCKGVPHPASFDMTIGQPVRALAAQGRLSIYGEMVDVLAERDEVDAAIALEAMWNNLAERASFRLLCGYSSAHFVSPRAEVRLRDVCGAHTHVRSDDNDPLAGWLLKRSELGFASGGFQASGT